MTPAETQTTTTSLPTRRSRWTLVGLASLVGCLVLGPSTPSVQAQDNAPQRLLEEARRLRDSDTNAALGELDLLLRQFPQDRLAPRALLEIIDIRRAQRDPRRTDDALRRLLDDYGRSPEAARGYVIKAEILRQTGRDRRQLEDARATYRRVPLLFGRVRYPTLDARAEALLASATISRVLGDDASASAEILTVIEDEPAGAFTDQARLDWAALLLDQGGWREASEVLQRMLDEQPAPEGQVPDDAGLGVEGDNRPVTRAGRMLTLIHRHIVRPLAGQRRWQGASAFGRGLQLKGASGVASHTDGRVVVTDDRLPLVAQLTPDGQIAVRTGSLRNKRKPWWDGDRSTVLDNDSVSQPFGGRSFELKAPDRDAPLKGLLAVERSGLGDRFVVTKSRNALLRYQSDVRSRSDLLAAGRHELVDLARDPIGRVYALDARGKTVHRVDLDQRSTRVVARGAWKKPVALAVDPLANVYVLDRGQRIVQIFDALGNASATVGPTLGNGIELKSPVDLAVDGSGRLFIADAKLPYLVVLQ